MWRENLVFSINDFKYSMDLDKDMFEFILSSYDKALSAVNSIFKDENVEEKTFFARLKFAHHPLMKYWGKGRQKDFKG